jgi:hypothetical protein
MWNNKLNRVCNSDAKSQNQTNYHDTAVLRGTQVMTYPSAAARVLHTNAAVIQDLLAAFKQWPSYSK